MKGGQEAAHLLFSGRASHQIQPGDSPDFRNLACNHAAQGGADEDVAILDASSDAHGLSDLGQALLAVVPDPIMCCEIRKRPQGGGYMRRSAPIPGSAWIMSRG